MQTCWRCGIEFEGSGDVCVDCTEQLPVPHWPVLTDFAEELWELRWELVQPHYQAGKLDTETAEALGIAVDTVRSVRRHFDKPANRRDDMHAWKDPRAQAEHAASMVGYRKNVGKGRLIANFEGST